MKQVKPIKRQGRPAVIAIGTAAVLLALGGLGSMWWQPPATPAATTPAATTPAARDTAAQQLLQRIDAARNDKTLDPTVASLLRDATRALGAQAARTAELEARIAALEHDRTGTPSSASNGIAPTTEHRRNDSAAGDATNAARGNPTATTAAQRQNDLRRLVASGASETDARTMLAFVDELALQQAEAQFRFYRASRAGNYSSREKARAPIQELARLSDVEGQLRDTFGDDATDRYLYAKGLPNRVRVSAVLPGSIADRAGLAPGDVLLSYDGRPVRELSDVPRLAAEGNEGESVELLTLRGNERLQLTVPRGALGFRGESASVNPSTGPR